MGMVFFVPWRLAAFLAQDCYNLPSGTGLDAFTRTKQLECRKERLARSADSACDLRAYDQFDHPYLPFHNSASHHRQV